MSQPKPAHKLQNKPNSQFQNSQLENIYSEITEEHPTTSNYNQTQKSVPNKSISKKTNVVSFADQ